MTSADSSANFSYTRVFNAPRELVFRTMTETEHLTSWWGPAGCSIDVLNNAPQAGGQFFYCMRFAPGVEMHGIFDYLEVTAPERIVYINGFADAEGQRIRHPMTPSWPLEMHNTVTLSVEDGGKTRMTLVSSPVNASDIEVETFKAGRSAMEQGFGGMYEAYERYLATL